MRDKIKGREELAELCEGFRKQGKKIGFTSGVFDLIHAGHVDYLEKAKSICDILIVGINSDAGVRKFKGNARPIVPEDERARIIAGLEAVDYVFIFGERRNKKNIELIKPHYYIKAGDYSKAELTSAEVVEKLGGQVKLIEKTFESSTTDIIEKILTSLPTPAGRAGADRSTYVSAGKVVEKGKAVHFPLLPAKVSPAVFLDRDGTISEEVEYLHEPEKFKFLPNAARGIKKMQDMGYKIVIVTNQGGIGLGYFSKEDFYRVNRKMLKGFSSADVTISKIYFCPHSKSEGCNCRKPNIALINRACSDLNLDVSRSFMIGDKTSDIEAGKRAGCKTILVRTGFGGRDEEFDVEPDYIADNLLDAADYISKAKQRTAKV